MRPVGQYKSPGRYPATSAPAPAGICSQRSGSQSLEQIGATGRGHWPVGAVAREIAQTFFGGVLPSADWAQSDFAGIADSCLGTSLAMATMVAAAVRHELVYGHTRISSARIRYPAAVMAQQGWGETTAISKTPIPVWPAARKLLFTSRRNKRGALRRQPVRSSAALVSGVVGVVQAFQGGVAGRGRWNVLLATRARRATGRGRGSAGPPAACRSCPVLSRRDDQAGFSSGVTTPSGLPIMMSASPSRPPADRQAFAIIERAECSSADRAR
ncbi:hypothetical protein FQR65_LT20826 [Abscondita terminalis]|nr:hypothetical protein FQR65_LT20826 [Abscondita terminalis]